LRCPFSALGIPPELASTYSFSRLMGHQRATWFLLASQWITATECVEAGLALEAVEPDALMPRVLEMATVLVSVPRESHCLSGHSHYACKSANTDRLAD